MSSIYVVRRRQTIVDHISTGLHEGQWGHHDVLISNAVDVCHLMPGCTVVVDTPAPDHEKPCKQINIAYSWFCQTNGRVFFARLCLRWSYYARTQHWNYWVAARQPDIVYRKYTWHYDTVSRLGRVVSHKTLVTLSHFPWPKKFIHLLRRERNVTNLQGGHKSNPLSRIIIKSY